jgi:tetratricopeptide (TPR) repeat protein
MSQALEKMIGQAIELCQQNKFAEAEVKLTKILKNDPNNLPALNISALVFAAQSNHKAAAESFKKALSFDPKNVSLHYNLAKALQELGEDRQSLPHHKKVIELSPNNIDARLNYGKSLCNLGDFENALVTYSDLLKISPNLPEALLNIGATLKELKRHEEALASYDQAIKLNPNYFEAWSNRGVTLSEIKRHEEALASYDQAIKLNPNYFKAWSNRGTPLKELKRHEEALASYDQAIKLNPNYFEAWSNRGITLSEIKRYEEALASYDRAIELNPNYFEAWSNKGLTLSEIKRYEEALASYDRAIELNPNYFVAWSNKGLTLSEIKRYEEALASYDRAIELDPNYCEAHFNRGAMQLSRLNFTDGWLGYEYRWSIANQTNKPLTTSRPYWAGDKKKARLLIWAEQGLGDQILHSSMLSDLKDFPQQKIISMDHRLTAIFSRSFPQYSFIDKEQVVPEELYDEQIPIGSLGQFFRKKESDFLLSPNPYLKDDNLKTSLIKSLLLNISNKKKCGISWQSSNPKLGVDKSIPLANFLPIFEDINLDFINLQYGETKAEILDIKERLGRSIHSLPEIDLFNDIDGLLSIICACDLIITTSNTTAHIAGACGKEALLLIPYSAGKLWYWQDINGMSLFYPSVRIFHQTIPGNWAQPINEIKMYLASN